MKILDLYHLHKVNETWLTHFGFTLKTSLLLAFYCVISLIHGIFPFIFTTTLSSGIAKLDEELGMRTDLPTRPEITD